MGKERNSGLCGKCPFALQMEATILHKHRNDLLVIIKNTVHPDYLLDQVIRQCQANGGSLAREGKKFPNCTFR
ncbi:MAG TPA: hypothetical protein VG895_05425 [Patescibacteria group bacterium]|nr:hypothetical protein [Patescibacteria group bacterium]